MKHVPYVYKHVVRTPHYGVRTVRRSSHTALPCHKPAAYRCITLPKPTKKPPMLENEHHTSASEGRKEKEESITHYNKRDSLTHTANTDCMTAAILPSMSVKLRKELQRPRKSKDDSVRRRFCHPPSFHGSTRYARTAASVLHPDRTRQRMKMKDVVFDFRSTEMLADPALRESLPLKDMAFERSPVRRRA